MLEALDHALIGHLDESWDIPCEASTHGERGSGPAAWIMWFACCPVTGRPYLLACTACKDFKLSYPVIRCREPDGGCGKVYTPGSTAYRYIEPLDKK